jgi:hypothetical protein
MGPFERSFRQPGLPDVWQSREDGVSPPPPPISEVRLSHLLYTATSIHGMHVSILSQQQVLIRVDRSQVNQRPAGHPILRPLWIATCQTSPPPPTYTGILYLAFALSNPRLMFTSKIRTPFYHKPNPPLSNYHIFPVPGPHSLVPPYLSRVSARSTNK